MKRNKQTKLSLSSDTVRLLSSGALQKAYGGQRAVSNTDEMNDCLCATQTCTLGTECWPDNPF